MFEKEKREKKCSTPFSGLDLTALRWLPGSWYQGKTCRSKNKGNKEDTNIP
jgi:hypothetical protein